MADNVFELWEYRDNDPEHKSPAKYAGSDETPEDFRDLAEGLEEGGVWWEVVEMQPDGSYLVIYDPETFWAEEVK